jgi:hypothetical protein
MLGGIHVLQLRVVHAAAGQVTATFAGLVWPLLTKTLVSCSMCRSYVFCRQRQDESLRRGGEQAAVVVLAGVPLSSMLLPLSLVAGHAFFSEGEQALAQVSLGPVMRCSLKDSAK